MNNFLLYQKKDKVFPVKVKLPDKSDGGIFYGINADFRNILRIFAMLKDRNIPEYKKIEKLIQWFYNFSDVDVGKTSIDDFIESFLDFVNGDKRERRNKRDVGGDVPYMEFHEPQFDFDFDAEEIYAGFISEYGIDLTETDFLHWYKFKILLGNLPSGSAFKKKIELRVMDLSGYRNYNGYAEMVKAKEAVQLPEDLFVQDEDEDVNENKSEEELKEFDNIWGKAGIN